MVLNNVWVMGLVMWFGDEFLVMDLLMYLGDGFGDVVGNALGDGFWKFCLFVNPLENRNQTHPSC